MGRLDADGTHVYHGALHGFDSRNVYHDGCPVCDARARSGLDVFGRLDDENLATLLASAQRIDAAGSYEPWQSANDRIVCELILRLSRLHRQIERAGGAGAA